MDPKRKFTSSPVEGKTRNFNLVSIASQTSYFTEARTDGLLSPPGSPGPPFIPVGPAAGPGSHASCVGLASSWRGRRCSWATSSPPPAGASQRSWKAAVKLDVSVISVSLCSSQRGIGTILRLFQNQLEVPHINFRDNY